MSELRNFTLRFFIAFLPLTLSALIFVNFHYFTKLELALSCLLVGGIPWLLYEILQRIDHQRLTHKAMLGFCTSMERIFTGMTSLEKSTQETPNEMLSELRMLQNLMTGLIEEKNNRPKTKPTIAPSSLEPENEVSASPPLREEFSESCLDMPNRQPENPPKTSPESVDKTITEESITKPLSRENLLKIIEKALNADNIEMLIQPIVSLPQRKARHFECFARIREKDGTIYTPDHFLHLAEEENLIRLLDNTMLFRCIQMARASVKKKFDVNFFCNMSQYTLFDKFFFDGLIEFLHTNRDLAKHLIFEFHEKAIANNLDKIEPFLQKLKLYNCRFSIDQVTTLNLDIKKLKKLNFNYIKFHSEALIKIIATDEGHKKVADFKKECHAHDIDVIISHIEDEKFLVQLNDFNFDYGQGFLFGTPVLSKT